MEMLSIAIIAEMDAKDARKIAQRSVAAYREVMKVAREARRIAREDVIRALQATNYAKFVQS